VTIRSGDGAGVAGLAFSETKSGVGLHWNVRIEGFEIGISGEGRDDNGYSFRDIELVGQRSAGIAVGRKHLTFHRLRYEGAAPLFKMDQRHSVLNLIEVDALCTADEPVRPIDYQNGTLFLQNVKLQGFDLSKLPLQSSQIEGETVQFGINADSMGSALPDFEHLNAHHLFDAKPWLLQPPSMPDYPRWPDNNAKVLVLKPSDSPAENLSQIQAAIDSGVTDLFLQRGLYEVDGPIILRGQIRRIHGGFSQLRARPPLATSENPEDAIFILEDMPHALIIEAFGKIGGGWSPNLVNRSSNTLIIRDVFFNNAHSTHYHNTGEGGTVVFENVKTRHSQRLKGPAKQPSFIFRNGHRALGWNFNPEQQQSMDVINDGSFLWVAGGKFGEREGPLVMTRNGGVTALYGIWLNVGKRMATDALLIFEDSYGYIAASFNKKGASENPHYVREVRDGEKRILTTTEVAGSGWGAPITYFFTPPPENMSGVIALPDADAPKYVPERINRTVVPLETLSEAPAQAPTEAGQAPTQAGQAPTEAGQANFQLSADRPELLWDFEQSGSDPLEGWQRLSRTIDIRTEDDGNRYLYLEVGAVRSVVAISPPVEAIQVSLRMKASGLDPEDTKKYRKPLMKVLFRDENQVRLGSPYNFLPLMQDADEWTVLQEKFDVPPGTTHMNVEFGKSHSSAQIGFDEIRIQVVETSGAN
jgi:hypothetical protein